jgi:myo-inositol-hexaphosphate 3-phosphohydrolase
MSDDKDLKAQGGRQFSKEASQPSGSLKLCRADVMTDSFGMFGIMSKPRKVGLWKHEAEARRGKPSKGIRP